ncbi:MAG: hypothetical protein BWY04_01499 [candidate division CPR1 bacterium ADurb.Bin160]|uniref:RiboL-PSP-HEPN domain-containing protein n=1 Tax=candidate division CPR1 bacterium ADurb.Bin160 TaxID=1852826 RepID=A0A1V5ZID2_9BACT|nr:MAG: hypothetical protein BWY04_01499 [candidate division CPR1 bacterium ADurb.Bin160]
MANDFQNKISNLENQGMYTESFYSYYFKVEHLAREVIKNGKAKIYAENLTQDISKILKKQKIDISKNKLETQYKNKLKSFFKKKEYKQREFLNIKDLIDVLVKNNISIEEEKIKNILQSKSGTARDLRNKLVHSNKEVSKSEYEKFKEDFNYVISLFKRILENDFK